MPNGITWAEVFGLSPLKDRARDALLTLRGDAHTPPTQFGTSSLRIFRPGQALRLWRGHFAEPRRAVIYNLYNHTPTPIERGWSVKKTQVRDFRGGDLSYDSHNATDFAVPLGTQVVAPAPARVSLITTEFNRGGLKIVLDHGAGLLTSHAHLGRALARPGQILRRGEPFALSGMSGMNGLLFFPWESPHLHMNVHWLGETVDPFCVAGARLWRDEEPRPARGDGEQGPPPSPWDLAALGAQLEACLHPERRAWLASIADLQLLAAALVHERHYYPTRFSRLLPLYARPSELLPRLDLPFSTDAVDGMAWPR